MSLESLARRFLPAETNSPEKESCSCTLLLRQARTKKSREQFPLRRATLEQREEENKKKWRKEDDDDAGCSVVGRREKIPAHERRECRKGKEEEVKEEVFRSLPDVRRHQDWGKFEEIYQRSSLSRRERKSSLSCFHLLYKGAFLTTEEIDQRNSGSRRERKSFFSCEQNSFSSRSLLRQEAGFKSKRSDAVFVAELASKKKKK